MITNLKKIAIKWSEYLGFKIDERDVVIMMQQVKEVRKESLAEKVGKIYNLLSGRGYGK